MSRNKKSELRPVETGLSISECHAQFAGKKPHAFGTNGHVYMDAKENFVIKQIKRSPAMNDARFANEVMIGHRAHELGVGPKIMNAGRCGQSYYIVMEKLVVVEKWTTRILRQALVMLHKLHMNGIAHRSPHAGNIMMRRSDGKVVLIDYGHSVLALDGEVLQSLKDTDYRLVCDGRIVPLEQEIMVLEWIQKYVGDLVQDPSGNIYKKFVSQVHPWSLPSLGSDTSIDKRIEEEGLKRDFELASTVFRLEK